MNQGSHTAIVVATLLLGLLIPTYRPQTSFAQQPPSHHSCFGTLTVTPSFVRVGEKLLLRGRGFTCKAPTGKLFSAAPVFLYRPHLGFRIFRVPVARSGLYRRTIVVPAKLTAVSAISGGRFKKVSTRPGTYYLSISLFDVHLDPINQALAHVRIVR